MKSFFSIGLLFSGVFSQTYDFDCNHYSLYTTDVCYQYSSSYQYLFICNGTDAISWYDYTDDSCTSSGGGNPYDITTISGSSVFQCDESSACDYFIMRYYTDSDCTGDSYYDTPFLANVCYDLSSYSYEYSCSGSKVTSKIYTSDDCSGSSTTTTFTVNDAYNEYYSGCFMVCLFLIRCL